MKWSRFLVSLLTVAACSASSDDLDAAHRRWRQQALTDYSFDYRTTGFAPPVDVRIRVTAGVPAVVENRRTDSVLALDQAPTIEALFDEVQRSQAEVTVHYDPRFGFPAMAHFDHGQEGDGFEVSAFQPAP